MTSILTQFPHPDSRAKRAMRMASCAFLAPEVFVKSVIPLGIYSRIFSYKDNEVNNREVVVVSNTGEKK